VIDRLPGLQKYKRLPLLGCLLGALILLGACGREERTDFCQNHYLYHADHQDTLALLEMTVDRDGLLQSSLSIPAAIFAEGEGRVDERMNNLGLMLSQEKVLYDLQTERDCESNLVKINQGSDRLDALFETRCGSDNRLRQVDVTLLDAVPDLEEIEVTFTTHATAKRFAISRRCPSAIFRLDSRAGKDVQNE
jgi:hypothetical protein